MPTNWVDFSLKLSHAFQPFAVSMQRIIRTVHYDWDYLIKYLIEYTSLDIYTQQTGVAAWLHSMLADKNDMPISRKWYRIKIT